MRFLGICTILSVLPVAYAQQGELKTAEQVLDRYKKALGGEDIIRNVRWETRRGEAEETGHEGKATLVFYSAPFKGLSRVTLPTGGEVTSGFDGKVSWSITPGGVKIDKNTPLEAIRRDADLQYALHQPDYFSKIELAGIAEFDGRRCYWLHGTTHWGKDNNQFYDVETGLLAGYRYQSDSSGSAVVTVLLFQDYKNFGGPMVATKMIDHTGDTVQTLRFTSVSYEPLDDSIFELPDAVKAQLKSVK
jgi:hypothetical protein